MSYILEALKKAQAERQIGALPTIHAPTLHGGGDDAGSGAKWKKPLWLALIAMAAAIVALLALVWRQVSPTAAPGAQVTAVPAASTAGVPSATVQPVPAPVQPMPAPVQPPAVAPVPAGAIPANAVEAASPAAGASSAARLAAAPAVSHLTPPVAHPAAPATATDAGHASPPAATAPAEEPVQALRDLPEPIQRAIPPISVGGYIYSKNPADRLLLIDKVLRHEGEELAPGFVLEKLLPKAAIFNYKGYRYRVAY